MKNDIELFECKKCGNLIEKLSNCNCKSCNSSISCCGENMTTVYIGAIDADKEKHIPSYTRVEDEIVVTVNHPMTKEHYIKWIIMVRDNVLQKVELYPEQDIEVRFKYMPGATIYSYCNKHGLWKNDVI